MLLDSVDILKLRLWSSVYNFNKSYTSQNVLFTFIKFMCGEIFINHDFAGSESARTV